MTTQTHGNFSPAEFPQCSVSHCSRQSQSRKPGSLCAPHYQKKYRGKDPEKFYVKSNGSTEPVCGIEACPRRRESSGMCRAHYSLATEGKIQPPEGFVVNLRPMCAFEGCVNRATSHRTGSICRSHDAQKRRVGHLSPLKVKGAQKCMVDACETQSSYTGLCGAHSSQSFKYKMDPSELSDLLLKGKCQSCGSTERLCVDHDHGSGAVRDLLCSSCNSALGLLGEDERRILALADYIRRFNS